MSEVVTVDESRALVRVILVEDSVDDAELVMPLCGGRAFAGCECVQTEATFRSALKAGAGVVISDLRLPAFDGLLALAVRREIAPEIPFILVSGGSTTPLPRPSRLRGQPITCSRTALVNSVPR